MGKERKREREKLKERKVGDRHIKKKVRREIETKKREINSEKGYWNKERRGNKERKKERKNTT